jgi:hypothetical protein
LEAVLETRRAIYLNECHAKTSRRIRRFLADLRFHVLRHEAITRLSCKLVNVLELAAVKGNKSLQVLKRYYNPRVEDLADKLAREVA